ncbi:hypothetical protein KIN20_035609 [Parelaphostrongylus tenuis]|uniref:Abnormal cell migration protein 18-like fibronectin type I domain-containing protein n=1 Tax=Parelaphostrongylus tenuis TaxID=148309 RepID=A0AAD5RC17_PARTN|nr:hypothetical protein KIN20_035609 [Parelaphostrongylus tenuis]
MRCKIDPNGSWRTEVSACIAPEETVVPVNDERQVGDYVWECRMSGNGQVMLRQRLSDRASCNGHPYGSEWVERSFKLDVVNEVHSVYRLCHFIWSFYSRR